MAPLASSRRWRGFVLAFDLLFGCLLPAAICGTILWRAWTAPYGRDDFEFLRPFVLALGFLCSLPVLFVALSGPVFGFARLWGAAESRRARFLAGWLTLSSFSACFAAAAFALPLLSAELRFSSEFDGVWPFYASLLASAALCGWIHFRTAEVLRATLAGEAPAVSKA